MAILALVYDEKLVKPKRHMLNSKNYMDFWQAKNGWISSEIMGFKGKSTEHHGFSIIIYKGFPYFFHLNHSTDPSASHAPASHRDHTLNGFPGCGLASPSKLRKHLILGKGIICLQDGAFQILSWLKNPLNIHYFKSYRPKTTLKFLIRRLNYLRGRIL